MGGLLSLIPCVLLLALPRPAPVPASQQELGKRLIGAFIAGDFAGVKPYFDSTVRANLNEEAFKGLQAQIKDLAGVIGDSLEQFQAGDDLARNYGPIYYREYRFVNEVSKGPPPVLINIAFPDSSSGRVLGVFLKRLAEIPGRAPARGVSTWRGEEKNLRGNETWEVGGSKIDVDETVLLDFAEGSMLAIKVYDDDAAHLTTDVAKKKAVPIVKYAVQKGLLKQAKAGNKAVLDRVAVAFLIRDGSGGFRVQLDPSEYR